MSTFNPIILGGPAVIKYKGASFWSRDSIVFDPSLLTFGVETDRFAQVDQRLDQVQASVQFTPIGILADLAVLFPYADLALGEWITLKRVVNAVTNAANTLTLTAHGMAQATPVRIFSSGAVPAGLDATTLYYVRETDANTIKLYPTEADANADTNAVSITDDGSGEMTLVEQWPLTIHSRSGKKLVLHNAAVSQMPSLNFRATEQLFGQISFAAYPKFGETYDEENSIYTLTNEALVEPSFNPASVITQPYTAGWGASAPWDSFTSKEGLQMSFNMSLEAQLTDSAGLITQKLSSLSVEVTGQPIGPAESDLLTKLGLQGSGNFRGKSMAGDDLNISATGVYARLYNAALTGGPQQFSSNQDRIGNLTWQATRSFTASVPDPLFYVGSAAPA